MVRMSRGALVGEEMGVLGLLLHSRHIGQSAWAQRQDVDISHGVIELHSLERHGGGWIRCILGPFGTHIEHLELPRRQFCLPSLFARLREEPGNKGRGSRTRRYAPAYTLREFSVTSPRVLRLFGKSSPRVLREFSASSPRLISFWFGLFSFSSERQENGEAHSVGKCCAVALTSRSKNRVYSRLTLCFLNGFPCADQELAHVSMELHKLKPAPLLEKWLFAWASMW
jgi:hypothetical protein